MIWLLIFLVAWGFVYLVCVGGTTELQTTSDFVLFLLITGSIALILTYAAYVSNQDYGWLS